MGPVLLVILIVFVVIPVFRIAYAIYKARRQAQRFFERFNNQNRAASGSRRQSEPQPKPAKRKKINPEDGEYVSFEEISVFRSTTTADNAGSSAQKVETEQQIVDVEWEDIK